MRFLLCLWGFVLPAIITASDTNTEKSENIIISIECLLVEVLIVVLEAISDPTQFCSDFLHISTLSFTVSTTSTATTSVTTTVTTGTTILFSPISTSTVTQTDTIVQCPSPTPNVVARREKYTRSRNDIVQAYPDGSADSLPPALKSFPSWEISAACSCLNIPTPSVTATVTVDLTSTFTSTDNVEATSTSYITALTTTTLTSTICPAPTPCGNEGVQWAYYWPDPEDVHYTNSEAYYNYYDPTVIKTVTPGYTSTTSYIYLHAPGTSAISIYGSSETFESTYFALNHRGYIYSELAGVYTFQSTAVDDILFFWGGPDAYSGWNKSNADAFDVGGYVGAPTFSVTLSAGIYYPIRIVYANAPTKSNENISITAPDGSVILGANSVPSTWVVQYSCDGVSGPPFEPFGMET